MPSRVLSVRVMSALSTDEPGVTSMSARATPAMERAPSEVTRLRGTYVLPAMDSVRHSSERRMSRPVSPVAASIQQRVQKYRCPGLGVTPSTEAQEAVRSASPQSGRMPGVMTTVLSHAETVPGLWAGDMRNTSSMVSLGGCSPVMTTLSGESHMSEKSTVGMCSLQSGASLRMGSPAMRRLELTHTKALMPEYPAF